MERFIDNMISEFETGNVDRREFCQRIALAASVYAAGCASGGNAPARGFRILGVNHLSYACPDYRKARDFYSSVFGMRVLNDTGTGRADLAFGPDPDKGGNVLVVQDRDTSRAASSEATIDHVCYSVSNWDETKVRAALAANGLTNPTGRNGSLHVYDPFDYDVQIGNIVEENAFRR